MTTPYHEARFAHWSAAHGVVQEDFSYARASGGRARGISLRPAKAVTSSSQTRVLFVHSTGSDAFYPQLALFKVLLAADCEVFSFDFDGHGRTSSTALDTLQATTAIPDALLAAGWSDAHLVGSSLGGAVALAHAAAAPSTVRSLSLVATPIRVSVSARAAIVEALSLFSPTFLSQWPDYGLGLLPALGPFRRATFPVRLRRGEPRSYLRVVSDLIAGLKLDDLAPRVTAPTLLVYGGKDHIASPADGRRLAAALPHARWHEEPGFTHLTLPYSRRACEAIRDFVRA